MNRHILKTHRLISPMMMVMRPGWSPIPPGWWRSATIPLALHSAVEFDESRHLFGNVYTAVAGGVGHSQSQILNESARRAHSAKALLRLRTAHLCRCGHWSGCRWRRRSWRWRWWRSWGCWFVASLCNNKIQSNG
jgi:hypothetical protein